MFLVFEKFKIMTLGYLQTRRQMISLSYCLHLENLIIFVGNWTHRLFKPLGLAINTVNCKMYNIPGFLLLCSSFLVMTMSSADPVYVPLSPITIMFLLTGLCWNCHSEMSAVSWLFLLLVQRNMPCTQMFLGCIGGKDKGFQCFMLFFERICIAEACIGFAI